FKLGYSLPKIAQERGLKEDTILNHLAQALELGLLRLGDVVELPDTELQQLQTAILSLPSEQQNALKPIYEQFAGQYSYGVLRCVKAALLYQTG
ncbi:MAG: ATP-dependent DNA helicase RecQ, partial [Methylococcaceae bacterium]|nr:ATP-dependent DNA helicase RecQ [Methylococcaceae bacterium]